MLLQVLVTEPGARLQKEFDDLDVVRQPLLLDQTNVFELRIVAEYALRKGLHQATLEIAMPSRFAQ